MDEAKDSVPTLQLLKHEILSGSVDGKVRRYDVRFGKLTCDTIDYPVTSVCFSRDEQCILVSSLDNKLRLLDKSSGEVLNEYKGHVNSDYKLDSVLSHTDGHVVSGSEDGRICFWDLVEGSLNLTLNHDAGNRRCIVYSVSFHPRHPCLLSAGSFGGVKVWKPADWDAQ
jgi:mitogen-activated protein kinase organizer 1